MHGKLDSNDNDNDNNTWIQNHPLAKVLMERLSQISELSDYYIIKDVEDDVIDNDAVVVVKSIIWRAWFIHKNDNDNEDCAAEKFFCTVLHSKSKVDRRSLVDFLSENMAQNMNMIQKDEEEDDDHHQMILMSRKIKIELAHPIDAERVSGYPIGAIPPLGHAMADIPILIDKALIVDYQNKTILLGGCGILGGESSSQHEASSDRLLRNKNDYSLRLLMDDFVKVKNVLLAPVSRLDPNELLWRGQRLHLKHVTNKLSQQERSHNTQSEKSISEILWSAASQKGGFPIVQNILSDIVCSKEDFDKLIWRRSPNGEGKNILHRGG